MTRHHHLTKKISFFYKINNLFFLYSFIFAGRLKDMTGSYDPGFYVAGFMIAISGLMLFFIPCLQRCTQTKKDEKNVSGKAVSA
jgi:hypothetical protein